ncbi:hypothetical protein M0802_008798 [Mischocyttarus mexicanus]|nr:hypothetical protein M0802_008798 [Mischocyttarus mexicanus]
MFSNGRKTIFLAGCACVGAYVAYRYWKKRELKSIDEGFDEVTKIDDSYERRVLLLGLDGAGKTSLMDQVCIIHGDGNPYKAPPQPTQGFTVYRLEMGSFTYNVWEIGGAETNRKYWSTFLQDTDLLIFMVDASDTSKLSLAVSTLKQLLGDSRMDTVPILVIANKQDAPNALRPNQVKEALDLQSISPHKHKVEVIGCQTRPLPDLQSGMTEYTWYHKSVNAVTKKLSCMAVY